MTDEETILALVNGLKAMKTIDMHADDIAYGQATVKQVGGKLVVTAPEPAASRA